MHHKLKPLLGAQAWTSQRLCLFIVQVAQVRGAAQTVPFIVQVAHVRGTQTVPSPSHLGVHAQDSPGRVSVLPLTCPCPNLAYVRQPTGVLALDCTLDDNLPLAPTVSY